MIDQEILEPDISELEEKISGEQPVTDNADVPEIDDLENDFKEFMTNKSEHNVEKLAEPQEKKTEFMPDANSDISIVEDFKLQIFLGLFFSLLDGIHVFLYKFISKVEIEKDQLSLDQTERESLEIYFKTKRVLEMINRLPSELIGIVHIEYLYYQKFQEIKNSQLPKLKTIQEKKPVIKRAPAKRKRVRKKAAKKQASE